MNIKHEFKKHSQKANALSFATNMAIFLPAIKGDIPSEYIAYYVAAMIGFNVIKFALTAYKQPEL